MAWTTEYIKEAKEDLENLDNSQRKQVLKAILKVSSNPLPNAEGGYGKPLGNHNNSKLAGYLKIKLLDLGIRVVYKTIKTENIMKIIIISVRDDDFVYRMAEKRKNN